MYRKLMIGVILCALCLAAGCAEEDKAVSSVPLVDTLSNGESFQFRGMDWFINEDEMLKHEKINEDDIEVSRTAIIYPHTILFEEVELKVDFVLYTFHDEPNMLVSGAYSASFDDEEKYLTTVNKVIHALDEKFGSSNKKVSEDLSFNLLNSNDSKMWWAEDHSMLTLSRFVDKSNPYPYTIFIKVSAPRDVP